VVRPNRKIFIHVHTVRNNGATQRSASKCASGLLDEGNIRKCTYKYIDHALQQYVQSEQTLVTVHRLNSRAARVSQNVNNQLIICILSGYF